MWLLPTKDRPERAQKAINSMRDRGMTGPGLVLYSGTGYRWLDLPDNWEAIDAGNLRCLPACKLGFRKARDAEWYGFASDDLAAKTDNFELEMVEAAGDWCIAAANDKWQFDKAEHKIPGFFLLGGELARAAGWIAPPGLQHSFIDNAWYEIGAALKLLRPLRDVVLEHEHAWNGKAKLDDTYRANYADLEEDQRIFAEWRERDLFRTLARIREAMKGEQKSHAGGR